MTATKYVVVCPDYRSLPMTRERAEKWLASVESTGHCRHEHTIIEAERKDFE